MYTPVPAFLTGDLIDEPFLNTYWRNNMAAGLPDMFSAKGQLAVGLGVDDMGVLNVGTNGMVLTADSAEMTGLKWSFNAVFFTTYRTNPNWDGDNHGTGTTIIAANTFNADLPNTARALIISVSAKWAAASGGSYINIKPTNNLQVCLAVRAQVAGYFQDNMGVVPLDALGQMYIEIAGAAADVGINVWGYLL